MIRKATINDLDQVYPLVMSASRCVFEDLLQSNDEKLVYDLFKLLYSTKNTKFYYDLIYVIEIDNKIASTIVVYDSSLESKYNQVMDNLLNPKSKLESEAYPNTYYIDTLATHPSFEKQGLARMLIEHVNKCYDKPLSLLVDTNKPNVRKYYEKLNFKKVDLVNLYNLSFDVMIKND